MPGDIPTYRPPRVPTYNPYEHSGDRQRAKNFYASARWRKLRHSFLMAHPFCALCSRPGSAGVEAEHVHHKIDRRVNPELELDWDNLEALCESCHSKVTRARINQSR